jgi:hypothetical protein
MRSARMVAGAVAYVIVVVLLTLTLLTIAYSTLPGLTRG